MEARNLIRHVAVGGWGISLPEVATVPCVSKQSIFRDAVRRDQRLRKKWWERKDLIE